MTHFIEISENERKTLINISSITRVQSNVPGGTKLYLQEANTASSIDVDDAYADVVDVLSARRA